MRHAGRPTHILGWPPRTSNGAPLRPRHAALGASPREHASCSCCSPPAAVTASSHTARAQLILGRYLLRWPALLNCSVPGSNTTSPMAVLSGARTMRPKYVNRGRSKTSPRGCARAMRNTTSFDNLLMKEIRMCRICLRHFAWNAFKRRRATADGPVVFSWRVRVRACVRACAHVAFARAHAHAHACACACPCACACAPAIGIIHPGWAVLSSCAWAFYICLRSGWGSDGKVYDVLRGLKNCWKPSEALRPTIGSSPPLGWISPGSLQSERKTIQ